MYFVIGLTYIGYHEFLAVPVHDRALSVDPTKGIAFPEGSIYDILNVTDVLLRMFWCESTPVSHINN